MNSLGRGNVLVPRNNICSQKWASPGVSRLSLKDPVAEVRQHEDEVAEGLDINKIGMELLKRMILVEMLRVVLGVVV